MPITVRIPTPLRPLSRGRDSVPVAGATARQVLESLERECPGMRSRICDESGEMRKFVNLFLNEEDVRQLNGLDSPVVDGDILSIVPAIAGGAPASLARALHGYRG